jgi:hypothetical protein
LPIGLATFVFGSWLIEDNDGLGVRGGVDWLGSVLVTAAMMAAVYAIVTASSEGWTSVQTEGFGGAAISLLVVFFVVEASVRNPILPLRILRIRGLTGASVARALLATGMFSNFFLGALLLQHVHGFSAFDTGLAFLPATLALAALSLGATARLMRSFGPRALLIPGLITITIALALEATAGEGAGYFPTLFGSYLLFGIGAGMSFMPLLTIMMAEVPAADAGVASGVGNVTMQVGGALGLAAIGTVSADRARGLVLTGHTVATALTNGYQLGFLIAAALVAGGLLVALIALRPAPRPRALPDTATEPVADAA